ncbi:MAG TPA: tetratricopeptide repeat protein [Vicinamibacteria bacterium]|nr:tetratricopeptide repeat protein [Vicinamibacteria bacterium]
MRHPVALSVALCALGTPASASAQVAPKTPPAAPAAKAHAPADTAAFDALAGQAKKARAEQRLDDAVELYQKALKLRPSWSEGRFGLGTVLYDLDRYEEARAAFKRVTLEQPKSGPAWALKGVCEFRLKNIETALADLQKGLALGLGDSADLQAVANYHAAILLTRFGQPEAAYEILKGFAVRDYDSPTVIEALGLSALRLPFLPSEAPVEKREMVLMTGRAVYLLVKNRRAEATRVAFEELVARYPEEPNVRYAYGVFLLRDEPQKALAEFRRVLEMQPTNLPALLQIVSQLIKEGDFAGARPYAERAVAMDPDHTAARSALGRVLLEAGETDRAIAELEEAVRLSPQNDQAFFALSRAYKRAGREAESRKALAVFVELDKARRAKSANAPEEGGASEPRTP